LPHPAEKLRRALQAGQGVAQLVRGDEQELIAGRQRGRCRLARGLGLLPKLRLLVVTQAQQLVGALLLGHVLDGPDVPDQRVVLETERGGPQAHGALAGPGVEELQLARVSLAQRRRGCPLVENAVPSGPLNESCPTVLERLVGRETADLLAAPA